jgi:hypothetical protein
MSRTTCATAVRSASQRRQALAIGEVELIDLHDSIAAAGHLVEAERIVQVIDPDALLDQWTRRVLEPALPTSVRGDELHVRSELEAVESDRNWRRHQPAAPD